MEFLRSEWDMRDMGGSKEPQMEANILGDLNSFDIRGTNGSLCQGNPWAIL